MAHTRSEARKGPLSDPGVFVILVTVAVIFCNLYKTIDAAPTSATTPAQDLPKIKDGLFARDNGSLISESHTGPGPVILGGTDDTTLEYEPSLILRCEAYGNSKPNVSWEYNGKPLPNNFLIQEDKNTPASKYDEADLADQETTASTEYNNNSNSNSNSNIPTVSPSTSSTSSAESNDLRMKNNFTKKSWVDFKLPKMNMAFYGTFVCKAVTQDGISSKTYVIIPNANSSVFMKLVRASVAVVALLLSVAIYRFCQLYVSRRKVQRYEKLPSQDLQIIQRFLKGIRMTPNATQGLKSNRCTSSLSTTSMITTIGESFDASNVPMYSTERTVEINSWIHSVAYDDRKDVLKDSFKIDLEKLVENSEYGQLLSGSFRSQKTMIWKPVEVKTSKGLEGLLTELKLLASLPEENDFIVNLQAAFTNKLYKRQVYVFVDLCQNGTLAKYIDLNRLKFRDLFARAQIGKDSGVQTPKKYGEFKIVYKGNDENENPSPVSEQRQGAWRFSTEELVVWSAEIADGMRFLHKNQITHGNLCTSNVFLTDGLVAKIGNIGYPPKESQRRNRRFPPECRLHQEFSLKSDTWSYGMTLWEMFTLRQKEAPSDQELTEFYSTGKRFISPRHSNNEIDELLYFCWNPEGNLRPDFEHLSKNVGLILSTFHV